MLPPTFEIGYQIAIRHSEDDSILCSGSANLLSGICARFDESDKVEAEKPVKSRHNCFNFHIVKKLKLGPLKLDVQTITKLDGLQLQEVLGGANNLRGAAASSGCDTGQSSCGNGNSSGCDTGQSSCDAAEMDMAIGF